MRAMDWKRTLPWLILVLLVAPAMLVQAGDRQVGYVARPCGFDMDDNGRIGEASDGHVGDGVTADPDGDGVDEDILYVDANTGSDASGDGSPARPFKTIQKALDTADGPGDGAEDIVCISGVFREQLQLRRSGVDGHYVRDDFQFPTNPFMLIGWDKDRDGQYPPFDTDDVAVLDGNVGEKNLAIGISTEGKLSNIEIAHLTIRNYGGGEFTQSGAMKLFHWGSGMQSHVYVHDVEMKSINRAYKDSSSRIVFSFWGGPMTDVAVINNLVDEYASYFCRGAPPKNSGRFRFQNITLNMYGISRGGFVTGWKLWGQHNGVEILDNILNVNAHAWKPKGSVSGVGVCQAAQDWVIRGNHFIDTGVTIQPFATGYPQGRKIDNILIDRNVFLRTYTGWGGGPLCIKISGSRPKDANEATDILEDATITNNLFTTTANYQTAIRCTTGNDIVPQTGTLTIVGNTIYGPLEYDTQWGFQKGRAILIAPKPNVVHKQQNFVIKNNIIANVGSGKNIEVNYAPTGFVANGNVYDPNGQFRWDEIKHWGTISFDKWQAATGQDANSKLAVPKFTSPPMDLHLAKGDKAARGFGVDITGITDHDFDGNPRKASSPTAGADVPGPPTPINVKVKPVPAIQPAKKK